jgi:hypothetical protein
VARRKLLTAVVLGAGSLAGLTLFRRRAARHREHVDVYAGDGAMVSIADGGAEEQRLLALAHDLIQVVA